MKMKDKRVFLLFWMLFMLLSVCAVGSERELDLGEGGQAVELLLFEEMRPGLLRDAQVTVRNSSETAYSLYLVDRRGEEPRALLSVWRDGVSICRQREVDRLYLGTCPPGEQMRLHFQAELEETMPMGFAEKVQQKGIQMPISPKGEWQFEKVAGEARPTQLPLTGDSLPEAVWGGCLLLLAAAFGGLAFCLREKR